MKIKDLKINDLVLEKNPYGFETKGLVISNPIEKEGVWEVDVIIKSQTIYTYWQTPDGKIKNIADQITELCYHADNKKR